MRFKTRLIINSVILIFFLSSTTLAGNVQITDIKHITNTSMDVDEPAWSPDNRSIAVSNISMSDFGEADELWLIDAQSGEKRKLLDQTQLKHYATYGYSIWDIEWKSPDTLTFIVSDNDVDSWQITLPINDPAEMKETFISYETADLFDFPEELKAFLLDYYPEDSAIRKNLVENYYYFHIKKHDGIWHVHHLRDPDFLVVDLKAKKAEKRKLSAKDIGDNLVFEAFGERMFAIYPPSIEKSTEQGRNWYYVDLIGRKEIVTPLFQTREYPGFKRLNNNEILVYSQTRTEHPFFQVELLHYTFGEKAEKLPTDGWHNLGISEDNTRIAFIKVIDGKRVLFTGKLK